MKVISLTAVCLVLSATLAFAKADRALPVATIEADRLSLAGVAAMRGDNAISVSGWVRRYPANYGPVIAHLHIETLNAEGQSIELIEGRWQGELPSAIRHRNRAASFHASLRASDAAASVRVAIIRGPRHQT